MVEIFLSRFVTIIADSKDRRLFIAKKLSHSFYYPGIENPELLTFNPCRICAFGIRPFSVQCLGILLSLQSLRLSSPINLSFSHFSLFTLNFSL